MQKQKVWFFFTFITLLFSNGFAHDPCVSPCFRSSSISCFLDDFGVAGDFLYWKPCVSELEYATVSSETDDKISLRYKTLCPDYEPGFRIILGRPSFYCDWGFVASYNYLQSSAHGSIDKFAGLSSPLIHPAVTPCITELFDAIEGSWKLHYNEWDALVTYDMSCCNPHHLFQPFIGIAGVNIKQEMNIDLTQGVHLDTIRWDSEYWGVGLRGGIEYQYLFNSCLRFFTVVHGTLLAGEADTDMRQQFCKEICIKDDDCCLILPGYHISVGLIYEGCFCHYHYSLRVGYEFLEWRNLPNHRIFAGENHNFEDGHASPGNIRSLAFHGLMAGAGFTF